MWYNPTLAWVSPFKAKTFPRKCIKDYPKEDSLQLYLRFNEGNGRIAFDYSKYKRHGVIYNTNWGKNDFDKYLWFNGINSYVQTPSFALTGTALSFVMWLNFSKQTFEQQPFNKGTQSSTTGYILIYRNVNTDILSYQYATGTTYATKSALNFFTGYDNQYVFVVITCDYQNKILKFYRNGQLHTAYDITDPMLFPSTSSACYIGSYRGNQHFFKGIIDEVRLYNRILSDQEIRMIYENEKDNYR